MLQNNSMFLNLFISTLHAYNYKTKLKAKNNKAKKKKVTFVIFSHQSTFEPEEKRNAFGS